MCVHKQKIEVCELCPGCNLTCIRGPNHDSCLYNVRNSPNKDPNLFKYGTPETKLVSVAGKKLKYKPGTAKFDPLDYKRFDIVKIVHKIFVAKPWIIKDIMNIEDHQMKAKQNHIEKGTVQKYGDQTVKTIQDLITTLKAPAVRKMGQQI